MALGTADMTVTKGINLVVWQMPPALTMVGSCVENEDCWKRLEKQVHGRALDVS